MQDEEKKPINITNSCSYTDKDEQSPDRFFFCSSKCRFIVSTINFRWWIYYRNVHPCYLHLLSNFCFTNISLSLACNSKLHTSYEMSTSHQVSYFAHLQHMCTDIHIHTHIYKCIYWIFQKISKYADFPEFYHNKTLG